MSAFRRALEDASPAHARGGSDPRRWIFAPYDQLTDAIGPLARTPPGEAGVLVVEAPAKAARRPYHKQKLALVLTNLRHFCLEQAARGVRVAHVVDTDPDAPYASAIRRHAAAHGPLVMMEAAERELRDELGPLVQEGLLEVVPHEAWISTEADFDAAARKGIGGRRVWRMDAFYRAVRKRTGILMDAGGKPVGGKLSFDEENRKPWRGEPPAPSPPRFVADEITREVAELVRTRFASHPGRLDPEAIPATRADAAASWRWALSACLREFGPYEDAMSTRSTGLFHTRISPLLNITRLLPRDIVRDVLAADLPIASQEGFVRQVIGWREFVRHVHRATDGFRAVPTSVLAAHEPLPAALWPSHRDARPHDGTPDGTPDGAWSGAPSGLRCLDTVVHDVWHEGYSHHITRLMIIANIATLLGVEPRALSDWFWAAYIDAYDWVVEPNVIGMGTYGVGDLITTKPYVSGAAYIDRMSDYCDECAFDPKKTCPITPMYWDFLHRNGAALAEVERLKMPLASSRKRDPDKKKADAALVQIVRGALREGRSVADAVRTSSAR